MTPTYTIKMRGLQTIGTISSSHSIKPRSMSYVGNYNHLPTHPVLAKQLKWGFRMQNLPISASKNCCQVFFHYYCHTLVHHCCQIFVHILLIPGQRALWWSDKV